ncbi:MAG: hypothetical protein ACI9MR_002840 [Myxococcota bacterium]|jgi:hypothetical protein
MNVPRNAAVPDSEVPMHLAATREALDRFAAELPAGLHADRLLATTQATRALITQSMGEPDGMSPWANHNLGVLVADGLQDPGARPAAITLFHATRRRLAEALAADPDDLTLTLALARGAVENLSDPRMAEDIALVAAGLGRPQTGPVLVAAAVTLVVRGARAEDATTKTAAREAIGAVMAATERLCAGLPAHPDLALDRLRLTSLAAGGQDGVERSETIGRLRGLLADHTKRFGPTRGARDVLADILRLEARGKVAPSDLRRDVLQLVEADIQHHTLGAGRTTKLLRALRRGEALDSATGARLQSLLTPHIDKDDSTWFEGRSLIMEAAGDSAGLVTLWEKTLAADADNRHAASGLMDRLVANLRQGLAAPFESTTFDRVLSATGHQVMKRWNAADVDAVIASVSETFSVGRAARFVVDKVLAVRELKGRDAIWKRVIAMASELDSDLRLDIARRAVAKGGSDEARLLLAETLVERGEHLAEADDVLRPLYEKRGENARKAQELRSKLKQHPGFQRAQYLTLLAYEQQVGIDSGKALPLRVVHTTGKYVLVELTGSNAPDFYEHRHLRSMVRAEDLPKGLDPGDLAKGDAVYAPLRGQDAEKGGLRVYWVADRKKVRVDLTPEAVAKRWSSDEKSFGIDSGRILPLKIMADQKRKRLNARILNAKNQEFRLRASVHRDRLPEDVDPAGIGGKGRRMWGTVVRTDDGSQGSERQYAVVGTLSLQAPEGAATGNKGDGRKRGDGRNKAAATEVAPAAAVTEAPAAPAAAAAAVTEAPAAPAAAAPAAPTPPAVPAAAPDPTPPAVPAAAPDPTPPTSEPAAVAEPKAAPAPVVAAADPKPAAPEVEG